MKRRNWSLDEKLAIVFEGLKEKRSVAEICREHRISQTLYYRWRDKFLEGGKKGLVNGAGDDNVYKAEIEKLQKIIGKQAIQIEILKKRTIYWGQGKCGGIFKQGWLYCL
jgi:transposase-like protein